MPLVSLAYPAAGNNTAKAPVLFSRGEAGRFIQLTGNLRIHEGRYRTRYSIEERPIYGDTEVVANWKARHTQAAIWYDPRSGQGTHYIGIGPARIVESAAGVLYSLTPAGRGYEVRDISNGMTAPARYRIAWLCQGENYVIRTDNVSPVQIFDGKTTFGSVGFSSVAKEASRFPNGSGPTVYAGGRLWTVLFGRRIYVSDALHQINQTDASDLLKFTDQSYDYTNTYFSPPTDAGDIALLTVTVSSGFDTSRAQGEVLAGCPDGPECWAVTLGIARELWSTANMRHTRSKETSPTGPAAFWVRDGDILMRTSRGIESLNLLEKERTKLGNSVIDLAAEMREVLKRDSEDALLFCSMINPLKWDRLFCTVAPVIEDRRHWHRGWITANWNPMSERNPQNYAWEGLHMLPRSTGRVVQFLSFRENGTSRVLALLDKDGTSKGLCELTQNEWHDRDTEGNPVPIDQFILTRRITAGGPFAATTFGELRLFLDDTRTDVSLQVYTRTNVSRTFRLAKTLEVQVVDKRGAALACGKDGDGGYDLGTPFSDEKNIRWVQILVRFTGVTSIDLALDASEPQALTNESVGDCVNLESDPLCDFDPFAATL